MEAACSLPVRQLDDGRSLGGTLLGGDGAPVHIDASFDDRAERWKGAGNGVKSVEVFAQPSPGNAAQQPNGIGVMRIAQELDGVALLHQLSGVEHPDAIAHRADHSEVVADEQHRGPGLLAERAHKVEDLSLHGGVEAGRRFVENQEPGVVRQRHGNHYSLGHAARQFVRIAIHYFADVGNLDQPQSFLGFQAGVASRRAADPEHFCHLAADPQ